MNPIEFLIYSDVIKSTVGFAFLDEVDATDHQSVYEFCGVVNNYMKMQNIMENDI
jgi:hypothetical protein